MHIVLGASGHVGSAVAHALLRAAQPVTVVVRDADRVAQLRQRGAQVEQADVRDVARLRRVLRKGQSLFLLNPPAPPSTDTVAEERESLHCILEALKDSDIGCVVAASTYGAQPSRDAGDLGVLYEMEQALGELPVQASVVRSAYYMSNWDAALQSAQDSGVVHTLYPTGFTLPMVAPHDIGEYAARLLVQAPAQPRLHFVEGPARYTPIDVAEALSRLLGKRVKAVETPPAGWHAALLALKFSGSAATAFERMTAATLEASFPDPATVHCGATSLAAYLAGAVRAAAG
jgi:uncharacterized protein YbjT (DUF2867 family)